MSERVMSPYVIFWEGGDQGECTVLIWPTLDVSDEAIEAEVRRELGKGPYEVEHTALAMHRHKRCDVNGFDYIDSHGEWHTHFEQRMGEPNMIRAYLVEGDPEDD